MKTSPAGRATITAREGRRLSAYRDSVGVLTIGVGHTGRMSPPAVTPGMTITPEECDAFLAADLAPVEAAINALGVPLSQNQFDALASFAFNIGLTGFRNSNVVVLLKLGAYANAADAMMNWVKPAVLKQRREAERKQFLTPDAASIASRPTPSATTPIVEKTINPPDQPRKGSIMEGFVFGLIKQQWQSVLRWGLTAAGTTLVARGTLTKDQVGNISPLVEGAIGALVALGSGTWSVMSNKPSSIISTADNLRARGH